MRHMLDHRTGKAWCTPRPALEPGPTPLTKTLSKVQCPECDDLVRKHRRSVATQAAGGLPITPDAAMRRWRFGDDVALLRARLLDKSKVSHRPGHRDVG